MKEKENEKLKDVLKDIPGAKIVVAGGASHGKVSLMHEVHEAMKKNGVIIAAYPGMGQEIFAEIYENYEHLKYSEFTKEMDELHTDLDERAYANAAIDMVSVHKGGMDICFVDAHTDVIKYLGQTDVAFITFYPITSKESIVQRMATMHNRKPSVYTAETLAYVIANHDEKIEELRLYSNSIASGTGILNEDLLKDFVKMDERERIAVIQSFTIMKKKKYKN